MKSYKGKEVDVSSLIEQQGNIMAVGNMKVNARGDLLGKFGQVVKTREQLENEYVSRLPNGAKQRQEDPQGFNKGFSQFVDAVSERIDSFDAETNDPFKKTAKDDANLQTDSSNRVKFSDIVKKDEPEKAEDITDLPLDDDFEISAEPEPKKEETKTTRNRKS